MRRALDLLSADRNHSLSCKWLSWSWGAHVPLIKDALCTVLFVAESTLNL